MPRCNYGIVTYSTSISPNESLKYKIFVQFLHTTMPGEDGKDPPKRHKKLDKKPLDNFGQAW